MAAFSCMFFLNSFKRNLGTTINYVRVLTRGGAVKNSYMILLGGVGGYELFLYKNLLELFFILTNCQLQLKYERDG